MTDPIAVRQALAAFLGEELFRKFATAFQSRYRMRFWQEKEWQRFTDAHPQFSIGEDDVPFVFNFCLVHGDDLVPGVAKVFHGCIDFSPEYNQAHAELFPHASDFISTEGRPLPDENTIGVYYCPSCRLIKKQWEGRRSGRPPAY